MAFAYVRVAGGLRYIHAYIHRECHFISIQTRFYGICIPHISIVWEIKDFIISQIFTLTNYKDILILKKAYSKKLICVCTMTWMKVFEVGKLYLILKMILMKILIKNIIDHTHEVIFFCQEISSKSIFKILGYNFEYNFTWESFLQQTKSYY